MSSVDVIVPCYRYGHFLRQCVESVLEQSSVTVRVLILDDASPDHTAEVGASLAEEDARVSFVRHPVNRGHIATFNEGIEWASADYLLLLSADDFLLPGALHRAVQLMDRHPEVGFTYGKALERWQEGSAGEAGAPDTAADGGECIMSGPRFIEMSGCRNFVQTPTVVVRTRLQKQVGGYNPVLTHSGDMEMWLRLAAHASVGRVEAYQAVYRRHADNMSLHYYQKNYLPDLQQRRLAIDSFFEAEGRRLRNESGLHRKMFRALGCEAIGFASTAFNTGDLQSSHQLSRFALDLSPWVRLSWPWVKLACKRRLGLRGWAALQTLRSRGAPR